MLITPSPTQPLRTLPTAKMRMREGLITAAAVQPARSLWGLANCGSGNGLAVAAGAGGSRSSMSHTGKRLMALRAARALLRSC